MNAQNFPTVTTQSPCPSQCPALNRPSREIIVRLLKVADLPHIEAHLLALNFADRQSRFHAFLRDDAIHNYVSTIDFQRMILAGAFDEESGHLVGLAGANLDAVRSPLRAEISVSVLVSYRGQGIGRRLTIVVLDAAAARGTRRADFYYQTENRAIARLVRDLGAPLVTAPGFASLALPLNLSQCSTERASIAFERDSWALAACSRGLSSSDRMVGALSNMPVKAPITEC